jgi:hypothetical protein
MIKSLFFISVIIFALNASAYFRDEQDAKISLALVTQFQRECSHKSGNDQSKIVELQTTFEKVRADKTPVGEKALQCYQDRMSQLIGIHQLYDELCGEVTREAGNRKDQDTLRLLLMTQRYRKGIGPFHDLLNDCLIEKGAGKYLVKAGKQKSESASLRDELEAMKIKKPFEASRVDYR